MAALLPHTPGGARLDAEDVRQVNPFTFDERSLDLLCANVVAVTSNFRRAGYHTVITGSLLNGDTYSSFRRSVTTSPTTSPSTSSTSPLPRLSATNEGSSASNYRYVTIDNSTQALADIVAAIRAAISEVYPPQRPRDP